MFYRDCKRRLLKLTPKIMCQTHSNELYRHITSNMTIALDNHPKSFHLIDQLIQKESRASIVTFSTDILKYVCQNSNLNIIFFTGTIDSSLHIITGASVIQRILQLNIDYYLCAAPYLDEKNNLYQVQPNIAAIQQALIQQSQQSYLINYPSNQKPTDKFTLYKIGQLNFS